MHTETISGLLSQKPTSPIPEPGQVKSFSWQQKTGKSGKPYIKVKNDDEEHGGAKCRILTVEQTDFVDSHGNISFNIEIEPLSGGEKCNSGNSGDETSPPVPPTQFSEVRNAMQADAAREHLRPTQAPETLAEKQAREARAFAEAKIYSAKARVLFEICWRHAGLIFPDTEGIADDAQRDLRMRLAQFLAIETKSKINVHNLPVNWPKGMENKNRKMGKPKPVELEDADPYGQHGEVDGPPNDVPNEKGEYPF